ncbi:MAG: hypothetical protein H7330_00615 [Hymenobacteraceae bacterium]|nr:hypothetical protein [Hymenobacteraceae bacterium]
MKSALLAVCLSALTIGSAVAQPTAPASEKKLLAVVTNSRADAEAIARANRLTDRMAQHLRLNNYQTSRLRKLNREQARQMYALEHRPGVAPQKTDEDCRGLCREQERDLRSLLSTAQYADYYEARNDFYSFDKQYAAQGRDASRAGNSQGGIILPGSPVAPELKEANNSPVLRQGK